MKIVRYFTETGQTRFGWVLENLVGPIEGTPFGEYRRLEAEFPLDKIRLLSPVEPGKIIGVSYNFADHARQQGIDAPEVPMMFLKPPSAVIGAGQPIVIPPQSRQVEHAGQLAVVMGRMGRWIPMDQAMDYVKGVTAANDVTARDLQLRDGQWARSKGFDTFCPLGPWIDTELDPTDILISCRVNGELRQMDSTHRMLFNIPQLIAFASSIMTLFPGDVLLTGTPAGVGPLSAGDIVEVDIEGLGELRNPVAAESGKR